jgi:phosphoadenosine phosphosulfate reductase
MPEIDQIIVAVSGGKDSLATLDICCSRFRRVEAFFLYTVKGLSFQESLFDYLESRYGVHVERIPHQDLARLQGEQILSWYRPSIEPFRVPSNRELYDHIRRRFGIDWIATGEKKNDNMLRRACMMLHGQWDWSRLCYYPLMDWSNVQVWNYNNLRNIPTPADYVWGRGSFAGMTGKDLYYLRHYFPEDYERVIAVFPFAAAVMKQYELYELKATPEVPRRNDEPQGNPQGSI